MLDDEKSDSLGLQKDYFANDFTHALLSSLAYHDHEDGDKLKFVKESKLKYNKYLENWHVEKVFSPSKSDDYYSILFLNPKEGHAVLAHRGTNLKDSIIGFNNSLKSDIVEVLNGNIGVQQIAAYESTQSALRIIREKNQTKGSDHKPYHFSLTGHSLGGWLAELSLYFCYKDFLHKDVRAVTFDSPGTGDHLQNYKSNMCNKNFDHNLLDLTTYCSAPNIVNTCNRHFGEMYRIYTKTFDPKKQVKAYLNQLQLPKKVTSTKHKLKSKPNPTKLIMKAIDSNEHYARVLIALTGHSLDPIIEVFDEKTGLPNYYKEVKDWPLLLHENSGKICAGEKILNEVASYLADQLYIPQVVINFATKAVANLVPTTTTSCIANIIAELLSGNINLVQISESFKNLKDGSQGYVEIRPKDGRSEFAINYNAHYKVLEANPCKFSTTKLTRGTKEWQLWSIARHNISKSASLSNETREALQELCVNYEIGIEDDSKVIFAKSPYNIKTLKDTLRFLIEGDKLLEKAINNSSLGSSQYEEYQEHNISNHLKPKIDKFITKKTVFEKIVKTLSQEKIAIINGIPGSGKSSVALEYGHQFSKKNNTVALWFKSDDKDKINELYRDLAAELEINIDQCMLQDQENIQSDRKAIDTEMLARLVNRKITKIAPDCVLFIFDGVEKYSDLGKNYEELTTLPAKILITTRNKNLLNKPKSSIYLNPFSKNEAISYIKDHLDDRFSEGEIKSLIKALMSKNKMVLPYDLNKTVAFLKANKLINLDNYIKDLKNNPNHDLMLFEQLAQNSPIAWKMLQYSAFLDSDFIDIKILENLMSLDTEKLQKVINDLEELSLANLIYKQEKYGLEIHRLVQENVKKYLNSSSKLKTTKKLLISDLIANINDSIALYQNNDLEDQLNITECFYPHMKRLIKFNLKTEGFADFCFNLGKYEKEAKRNYEFAQSCQENANKIYKALYSNNHIKILKTNYEMINIARNKKSYNKANVLCKKNLNLMNSLGNEHSDIKAKIIYEMGTVLYFLDKASDALKYHLKSLELREKLHGQDHIDIARSLEGIMCSHDKLGNHHEAWKYGQQALEMKQRIYKQDHIDISWSLDNLAHIHKQMKQYEKSIELKLHALKIRQKLYNEDHMDLVHSLCSIGNAYLDLNKYDEAINYHIAALKMKQRIYQEDNLDIVLSLSDLASLHLDCQKYEEALDYQMQALEMKQKLYKTSYFENVADNTSYKTYKLTRDDMSSYDCAQPFLQPINIQTLQKGDHPEVSKSLYEVGLIYDKLNQYNNAINYKLQALEMTRRIYTENSIECANLLYSLSLTYNDWGKYESAIDCCSKALKIQQNCYMGNDNFEIANSLYSLGVSYDGLGDIEQSLNFKLKALNVKQKLYKTSSHPDTIDLLASVADCYDKIGDYKQAFAYNLQILGLQEEMYGRIDHLEMAHSLNNLGNNCHKLTMYDDALNFKLQALAMIQRIYKKSDHPDIIDFLNSLVDSYLVLDKSNYRTAEESIEQAIEMNKRLNNKNYCGKMLISLTKLKKIYLLKNTKAKFSLEELDYIVENTSKSLDAILSSKNRAKKLSDLPSKKAKVVKQFLKYQGEFLELKLNTELNNAEAVGENLQMLVDHYKTSLELIPEYKYKLLRCEKMMNLLFNLNTRPVFSFDQLDNTFLEMDLIAEQLSDTLYKIYSSVGKVKHSFSIKNIKKSSPINSPSIIKRGSKSSKKKFGEDIFTEDQLSSPNSSPTLKRSSTHDKFSEKKLTKALGNYNSEHNLELARILCFEAICLGISQLPQRKKSYKALDDYIEMYPDIANKVLRINPGCFVDEDILSHCSEYIDSKNDLDNLLKSIDGIFSVDEMFAKIELSDLDDKEEISFDNERSYFQENSEISTLGDLPEKYDSDC